MKKLLNPILKYFNLQLVKRPKQRRTNLKGWKQQGRGTRVTMPSDKAVSSLLELMALDAREREEDSLRSSIQFIQNSHHKQFDLSKYPRIPKGAKQGVPVWTKTKRRKYTKHESTIGPFTKQSKNIIIKAMGLEEKK